MRKVGLFFLSMWLFFILAIIITSDIPIYWDSDWVFVGFNELLRKNIIPIIFLFCILIGAYAYYDFHKLNQGATDIPFRIESIENKSYEHLTFLTTYIIPLIALNLSSAKYILALIVLLVVICIIYVQTDLFYTNPTLAIFGFKLYKVDGLFKNEDRRENIILISKDALKKHDTCDYIKLDERIYYAKIKPKK